MFYKFIHLISILSFMLIHMSTIYCYELKTLEDVLDDSTSISVEEKIEFLTSLKNNTPSFSEKDFRVMNDILMTQDLDIKLLILEILLKDDVVSFPSSLTHTLVDVFILNDKFCYSVKEFLPLKVLIKSNSLRLGKYDHYIFIPIYSPKEEEESIIYNYEKYLTDHLKFMRVDYIRYNFRWGIERSFKASKHKEFKSKYIESMFYLDMTDSLIKIMLSKDTDSSFRIQAIETSLKLLPHSLKFKEFSKDFVEALETISTDSKEESTLRDFSDYILTMIRLGKISLKNYDSLSLCSKFFSL